MSQLQEWFEDNPKARPLLMFAVLGLALVLVGVWLEAGGRRSLPVAHQSPELHATPDIPTMVGGTPSVRPTTTAWVAGKEVPLFEEPGLNLPVVRKLNQWEEVSWLQERDGWDQLRLSDGTLGWVQVRFVTFVKPIDLAKPNGAELTVMAFYAAVVRRDYAAAYSYLGPSWKSELDFRNFVQGYSLTSSLRTEIDKVIPLGDQRYQVDVRMKAVEQGQEIPYAGSYLVEKSNEEWFLSSGSLTVLSGPRANPRLPDVPPGAVLEPTPVSPTPSSLGEESPTPVEVEESH